MIEVSLFVVFTLKCKWFLQLYVTLHGLLVGKILAPLVVIVVRQTFFFFWQFSKMDKTALTFSSPYIKKSLRLLKISDPLSFIPRLSQDQNLWHHRELEDKALQRTRETEASGSFRELCNFQIITHVLFRFYFEHLTSLLWTKTSSFILLITSVSYCDVIILEDGRQKTEIIQVGKSYWRKQI